MRQVANRSVNRVPVKQVVTGLTMLDYTLAGGMRAGSMIVLAARPSVGKSAFAAQIAVDVAKDNKRVLFVSLEMPSTDIVCRVLSFETGVRFAEIMGGSMAPDGIDRCLRTADLYESIPLEMIDQRNLSIDRLVGLVRSKATTTRLDLVVVDYLGLLQGDRRKPRWEAITEISHALKTLALAENLPILCLSQLNREAEGEKPRLSNLRDAGAVEQDADVVMLMHRERGKPRTELIVAKNRNGNVGSVMLEFQKDSLRFSQSLNQNPEEDETQPISPPTSVNDFSSYTQRTSIF
jgi:replicative DNA helicase